MAGPGLCLIFSVSVREGGHLLICCPQALVITFGSLYFVLLPQT